MTVLIDSGAWIEYFKGGKHAKEAMSHIEGDEDSLVSSINLTEIYAWIAKTYGDAIAAEKIATVEKRCYVIPLEGEISISAARLKIRYRLGIADGVVLATARQLNAKIVTGDPDFEKIDGVIFIGELPK